MRVTTTTMGIPLSFHLPEHRGLAAADPPGARAAVTAGLELLNDAEQRFSRNLPDSELSALRRGELAEQDASPELREVLGLARQAGVASGGAFDVTDRDGLIDTDGIVKGWAAERAATLVASHGVTDLCLNVGGDVAVRGEPEPGRPWSVAVRHPADPQRVTAVVHLHDGGVATSGTSERGAHLWDGRTGLPVAHSLGSVTVLASALTTADILATSAFVLGPEGVNWALQQGAVWALALAPDGTVVAHGGVGVTESPSTVTAAAPNSSPAGRRPPSIPGPNLA
jgi:thiamine biosynthesis lipoprotein